MSVPAVSREQALRECERIAAKDRSNLYRVSLFLADPLRWEAFLAFYAAMRVIDDRVDGLTEAGRLTPAALARERGALDEWAARLDSARRGQPRSEPLDVGLAHAFASFAIPLSIWTDFLSAMAWDLEHDRFETAEEFLRYAIGATAAPTRIFVRLLTSEPQPQETSAPGGRGAFEAPRYRVPDRGDGFDAEACGHELGVFAYIGHILRDVAHDLTLGPRGRIYIPLADLREAGLSEADLRRFVDARAGDSRWHACVRALVARARAFEARGVSLEAARRDALRPDCRFILRLIIRLYQDLLDRIEADPDAPLRGDPLQGDHERAALATRAAAESGFQPDPARAPAS